MSKSARRKDKRKAKKLENRAAKAEQASKEKAKNMSIGIGIVVVIVIAIGSAVWVSGQPGKYEEFAQCLTDKGAVFYGAYWCPHCKHQKELFGKAVDSINYVECSLPGGRGQTPACISENINSYPTWKFSDGSVETGSLAMEQLAAKTGCVLP